MEIKKKCPVCGMIVEEDYQNKLIVVYKNFHSPPCIDCVTYLREFKP
jgi:hypothetical protein